MRHFSARRTSASGLPRGETEDNLNPPPCSHPLALSLLEYNLEAVPPTKRRLPQLGYKEEIE